MALKANASLAVNCLPPPLVSVPGCVRPSSPSSASSNRLAGSRCTPAMACATVSRSSGSLAATLTLVKELVAEMPCRMAST